MAYRVHSSGVANVTLNEEEELTTITEPSAVTVEVDLTVMGDGDSVTLRKYAADDVEATSWVLAEQHTLDDEQVETVQFLPDQVGYGLLYTIEQNAGSAKDFPWNCKQVTHEYAWPPQGTFFIDDDGNVAAVVPSPDDALSFDEDGLIVLSV